MNSTPTARFNEFIDYFPVLELPISLLPDISQIPTDETPLPGSLLEDYILPFEGEEVDDFTEYIPYGRIGGDRKFEALIYWKAGVMQYEFVLATFSKNGEPINHAIVGGIRSDEKGMLHSVCVIHDDLSITIAEGMDSSEGGSEDNNNTYQMRIDDAGTINYGLNEEDQ